MGYDDELRTLAQIIKDLQESAEVGIIERRLHLIHDVKRAGARLEDGDQQSNSGQGTLTTTEQRQAFNLFARRPHAHLDAGREQVIRIGKRNTPGAAREQDGEDRVEGRPSVLESAAEDVLHLLVDLLDDDHQIGACARQVSELFGQELVTLLKRCELLQS